MTLRPLVPLLLLALACANAAPTVPLPYQNSTLPVEQRVEDLLARMTLREKVVLLDGGSHMETAGIKRLGIPAIKMVNGPMGVRAWQEARRHSAEDNSATNNSSPYTSASNSSAPHTAASSDVTATAFPAGIALAATWDPELVQRQGQAIAQQVKALGRDMLLAPAVNISRLPLWGRNFESYGEDPYLAARMGVAYIRGVQGEGVIASVKHLAAYSQELQRRHSDVQLDSRALNEIYLPPFKAAVQEAGVWSVMTAANKINGVPAAENSPLLNDLLRGQWGFKGFTLSAGDAPNAVSAPVNGGLDVNLTGGARQGKPLADPTANNDATHNSLPDVDRILAEVDAGHIDQSTVEARAGDILRVMFTSGLFDRPPAPANGRLDTPPQRAVARQVATESIVLLKNEQSLLPLDNHPLRSIAVIGPNAATARVGGGGSSLVRPRQVITPLDGIRRRAGVGVRVDYALGVSMEGEDPSQDTTPVRDAQLQQAVDLAAKADVAVVVVGRSAQLETEGSDIASMHLPPGQEALIQAVAEANPRTLVVLNTGSPVDVRRWLAQVPALLDMWYGGQEGGAALAAVLFGDANPSGKLPMTFPKSWEDSPGYARYSSERQRLNYAEGIYVGYRYFDKNNLPPQFPFGYGLSYTTFDYSGLQVVTHETGDPVADVSLQVRNSGNRAGAEVVQLYIRDDHSRIDRPLRELKRFARVELQPGESKTVSFTLDRAALSYYSPHDKDFVSEPGQFEVQVGASSRDIRVEAPLVLAEPDSGLRR